MPPKKRGREAPSPNSNSDSKSNTQTRKPDPSPPSSAPGPVPLARDAPARSISQSLSGGPSAKKAVGDGSPNVGPTASKEEQILMPAGSTASSQCLTVGSQSESAGGGSDSASGKSNFKKKVVKRVVRKVKKPCLAVETEPELVDANDNAKMDLEEVNSVVDKVTVAEPKPTPPTSAVEAVAGETAVVPAQVVTTTSESLTSGPEPNTEKSSEAKEPEVGKGKVKKVIRKVIKKKIVKRMVPKGTLASKKAAEAALGLAEEQAKSGNLETNKLVEEKNEGIVHDVNPSRNLQHTKEEIRHCIGEKKGDTGEKSNMRGGSSRENATSESGNKKDGEESKDTITKIEGDGEKNKIGAGSVNRKEINGEIKVGDDSQKMKADCSASNNERKVRKVIKKKIIKKLVPKGTLLAKRSANSEGENCNPKCEGIVNMGEKPETENAGPNKEVEKPQQGSIIALSDKIPQNPNFSLNACTKEMDGLTERQKRRKTEIFIGGLDKGVGEMDIRTVFGKAGEIVEVRMFLENNTGKNKGYCFLRYKEPTQAKKAISMFSKVETLSANHKTGFADNVCGLPTSKIGISEYVANVVVQHLWRTMIAFFLAILTRDGKRMM